MARTTAPRKARLYDFKGKAYLLVGGALTTAWHFRHGRPSFAHLYPDGTIKRYGKQIGTRKDLKFLEWETLPTPTDEATLMVAVFGTFNHPRRHQ